jgi:membrane fusion protein, multidrug efflux system
MKHRQLYLLGATLATALGIGVVACARHSTSEPAPVVRPVRVAAVTTAPVNEAVRAVGVLGPKDEARLAFKTGGVIEAIRVEEGAAVKAGQVLAYVRQTEVGASLEQARQAAEKTERDLNRVKALYADGVATEEQVQDLTTAYRVASAAQRTAEFNAAYARIVAPADGVVLRKLAQANELVQAGQTVLVVGAATRGWVVRIGLADRDVVRFRLGDPARVEFDAFPAQGFTGRISNLGSSADTATGTFTVEIQVEPGRARFVQGLVARVRLEPQDVGLAQVVPLSALIEANGSEASIFVFDRGRRLVHRVVIRIGRLRDGSVEVLDGVAAGTEVVVDGAAFLADGEAVRIAREPPAGAAHAG